MMRLLWPRLHGCWPSCRAILAGPVSSSRRSAPPVRAVWHQPLLSSAPHPSRPEMSQMAGTRHGGDRDVLSAGNARALGGDTSPASSIRRPAGGSAQPTCKLLLGPHGLDSGAPAGTGAPRDLRALRQGY